MKNIQFPDPTDPGSSVNAVAVISQITIRPAERWAIALVAVYRSQNAIQNGASPIAELKIAVQGDATSEVLNEQGDVEFPATPSYEQATTGMVTDVQTFMLNQAFPE